MGTMDHLSFETTLCSAALSYYGRSKQTENQERKKETYGTRLDTRLSAHEFWSAWLELLRFVRHDQNFSERFKSVRSRDYKHTMPL